MMQGPETAPRRTETQDQLAGTQPHRPCPDLASLWTLYVRSSNFAFFYTQSQQPPVVPTAVPVAFHPGPPYRKLGNVDCK
jgi:hypothetical protein